MSGPLPKPDPVGLIDSGDCETLKQAPCNCLVRRIICLPRGFVSCLHPFLDKKRIMSARFTENGECGTPDCEFNAYHYYELPIGWRIMSRSDGIRVVLDENGKPQICTLMGGKAAWIVNEGDCNDWMWDANRIINIDDLYGNRVYQKYLDAKSRNVKKASK